jgi:hypothetical protein
MDYADAKLSVRGVNERPRNEDAYQEDYVCYKWWYSRRKVH